MAMREILNHAARGKARETLTVLRTCCLWNAGPEATVPRCNTYDSYINYAVLDFCINSLSVSKMDAF